MVQDPSQHPVAGCWLNLPATLTDSGHICACFTPPPPPGSRALWPGIVIKGDVTLDNTTGKVMDDHIAPPPPPRWAGPLW